MHSLAEVSPPPDTRLGFQRLQHWNSTQRIQRKECIFLNISSYSFTLSVHISIITSRSVLILWISCWLQMLAQSCFTNSQQGLNYSKLPHWHQSKRCTVECRTSTNKMWSFLCVIWKALVASNDHREFKFPKIGGGGGCPKNLHIYKAHYCAHSLSPPTFSKHYFAILIHSSKWNSANNTLGLQKYVIYSTRGLCKTL